MEQPKQRVFVFDKAELFFLFLFFIVMAITSFVLGMRLGKKQAELFLHPEATKPVTSLELKSEHEENVDKTINAEHTATTTNESNAETKVPTAEESTAFVDKSDSHNSQAQSSDMDEETFKKLQEEYQKINTKDMEAGTSSATATGNTLSDTNPTQQLAPEKPLEQVIPEPQVTVEDKSFLSADKSFIGKFTIQLGSFRTISEAKNFAQGFLERGYKPIIREVEVRGQGLWYRVSLGVFETMNAASQYVQKEKSLFSSFKKDQYFVQEIK